MEVGSVVEADHRIRLEGLGVGILYEGMGWGLVEGR